MAENDFSASLHDGSPVPGLHLVTSGSSRPACTGKVTWTTVPERDTSECVLPYGHGGDHRDAGGYPWNEGRWLD
jgi:hypothetical protein